jgi:decaprenylphospho-beta-D-erythro-pentofuranosid-2-ulose 2-reductase
MTTPPPRPPQPSPSAHRSRRILLLGGTSEIGLAIVSALALRPDDEVVLAGRHPDRLAKVAAGLPCRSGLATFDATDTSQHQALADQVFAEGPLDLAISAAGVLLPQDELDRHPERAAHLIQSNLTGHVSILLALAGHMRARRQGTLVVLSSIAAVRPRQANFVYGAAKAGLDAFARGLSDRLHGTGVRVLLVRPGFVIGCMTKGMPPAPLSSTPKEVGRAVAAALARGSRTVWVPRPLAALALVMTLVPRPLWRRMRR